MKEKQLQNKIIKVLRERGGYCFKTHSGKYQHPSRQGLPDIMCCYNGLFVAFEVKLPGRKPTRLQEYEMEKIGESGGIAMVASDVESVIARLKEIEAWGV